MDDAVENAYSRVCAVLNSPKSLPFASFKSSVESLSLPASFTDAILRNCEAASNGGEVNQSHVYEAVLALNSYPAVALPSPGEDSMDTSSLEAVSSDMPHSPMVLAALGGMGVFERDRLDTMIQQLTTNEHVVSLSRELKQTTAQLAVARAEKLTADRELAEMENARATEQSRLSQALADLSRASDRASAAEVRRLAAETELERAASRASVWEARYVQASAECARLAEEHANNIEELVQRHAVERTELERRLRAQAIVSPWRRGADASTSSADLSMALDMSLSLPDEADIESESLRRRASLGLTMQEEMARVAVLAGVEEPVLLVPGSPAMLVEGKKEVATNEDDMAFLQGGREREDAEEWQQEERERQRLVEERQLAQYDRMLAMLQVMHTKDSMGSVDRVYGLLAVWMPLFQILLIAVIVYAFYWTRIATPTPYYYA